MRDRSIPEDWSTGKPSRIEDANSHPTKSQPEDAGGISKHIPQRSINSEASLHRHSGLPNTPSSPKKLEPSGPADTNVRSWWKNWMLWAVAAGLCSTGVGFIAVAVLLKLPSAPNCPSIFWPLASATVRLHCAQVAANKQTLDDLLQAIALVHVLPKNHSLRPEIDRYLAQWSLDILDLADEQFQTGNLPLAIAVAKKIPPDLTTTQVVQQRIAKWQSTWSEAESIYAAAEAELPEKHWHRAFMTAVRLLNVGNSYWATTKYEELKNLIETAREDANKLLKAEDLADRGDIANLLAAFKLVNGIGKSSYIYPQAQKMISELGRKMLGLAQAALDQGDVAQAIEIANQIPPLTELEPKVQDFIVIAEARRNARIGTVSGLEAAIETAQKIELDRPSYNQAQELIARWQLEIEDVKHLERARELALPGTVGDLVAAIAEASLVPETNPRIAEAREEIAGWRRQVETSEDQPYLSRAEELAASGDVSDLQAAINEASQITKGRALYRQARRRIRTWTRQVQTIQDQPYLDQARELASNDNLPAAIAAAQQIRSGRALYGEAQAAVNDWQSTIQARQNWQEAQQIAQEGTPDALSRAIRLANRVPVTSPLRADANPAINEWGQRLLVLAQERGAYDIPGGIAIAEKVPRSSDVYQAAQEQIAEWQKILNPPPLEPLVEPSPEFSPSVVPGN